MGLSNPSRETKFSGTNADREILFFSYSADHVQGWQPYPFDPYSVTSDIYIVDTFFDTLHVRVRRLYTKTLVQDPDQGLQPLHSMAGAIL